VGFTNEERDQFTSLVQENVLNTDVTTTMPMAKDFEKKRRPSAGVLDFERRASFSHELEAKEVMCMIIKAADISNPSRRLDVYNKWIDGVMTEFFVQGDYERAKGMAFSMNCDRESVVLAKAQIGFISFLVGPLFKALHTYAPSLQPVVDRIAANKEHFEKLAEQA